MNDLPVAVLDQIVRQQAEIDRLKDEINRLRQYDLMTTNHTCIKNDDWQAHLEEIDRLKAELEEERSSWSLKAVEQFNRADDLERQLAEARVEVERLSALTGEWCKTAEMYRRFETETSKQTAGEICDYLQRSSTDDEISKGYVIDHIKRRFGLEG